LAAVNVYVFVLVAVFTASSVVMVVAPRVTFWRPGRPRPDLPRQTLRAVRGVGTVQTLVGVLLMFVISR
jgi:hypothetical protein